MSATFTPRFTAEPIGTIKLWASETMPSNGTWITLHGQAISRVTYAALFALWGITYGDGDGSTTFNVPDLRGRIPAGKDDMGGTPAGQLGYGEWLPNTTLGGTGGAPSVGLSLTDIPAGIPAFLQWSSVDGNYDGSTTSALVGYEYTGGGANHNNIQPTIILLYVARVL